MQRKTIIVLPTYNNESTIGKVLKGVQRYGLPTAVVDDGSTDGTSTVLDGISGIERISFSVNRGKGAALRAAFEWAAKEGYSHAITLDADGQHLTEDIAFFLEKIREDPDALWIGDRLLPVEGGVAQPPGSRFGRKFGAFWYRYYTGIPIRDTQCGFRAYPLKSIATTGCRRSRFEYEIEVLILAAWRGIPVKSVPIHLLYQAKKERVSHFRMVRDFMRISRVNARAGFTRVVFPKELLDAPGLGIREKMVALVKHELRVHTSPEKVSFSLATGVFMAIMPVHGFQVIILIALTCLFRLNRPLALVGVSVSSAPALPFWIAAGIGVGNLVVPSSLSAPLAAAAETYLPQLVLEWVAKLPVQGVFEGVVIWFLGSIVLAALCGAATFGVSYPLVKKLVERRNNSKGR